MESALQTGIAAKLQYLGRCLASTNTGPKRCIYKKPRSHYTRDAILFRIGGPASRGGMEAEAVDYDVAWAQAAAVRALSGPLSGADLARVDALMIGMPCEVKISGLGRAAPLARCAD